MAYIIMAYMVMAYIVMAYVVMAYVAMAYVIMALDKEPSVHTSTHVSIASTYTFVHELIFLGVGRMGATNWMYWVMLWLVCEAMYFCGPWLYI